MILIAKHTGRKIQLIATVPHMGANVNIEPRWKNVTNIQVNNVNRS